jgi:hypothetical protein
MEEWAKFLNAEAIQESGGNWSARNANSGALGRWQVMPDNICPWARESGLACESSDYFLTNHAYQQSIVTHILGGYFDQYGPAGAAAMWYSGQPNPDVYYGDPSVHDYVNDVLRLMSYPLLSGAAGAPVPSDTQFPSAPNPDSTDSWTPQISNASGQINLASKDLLAYRTVIAGYLA